MTNMMLAVMIGEWFPAPAILLALFVLTGIGMAVVFLTRRSHEKSKAPDPLPTDTVRLPRKCPKCGSALKADVPEGLCPACLLQQGIATEVGGDSREQSFVPPTISELSRLFPQLEIISAIGKGGMGAVYKARQPALDRFVALKILAPKPGNELDFESRFSREAKALARLSHPNIVAVYDFGVVSGVSPDVSSGKLGVSPDISSGQSGHRLDATRLSYFIMEYVDGPNLRQVQQAGRLSPREALEIIPQICTALQFAHDEGIVHRDIKPENVLLDKKGRVKIADFGLAKILGQETQDFRLTGARDVMGTPHYMAPEQVEKPQEVDHRADIFSLGVVFYEMLTGELPLGRFAPPSQKVQVDVRLDEVVLRALEKEPSRRYQQASQFRTGVETIASTPGQSGHPPQYSAVPKSSPKNRNWLANGLAAGALVFALVLATALAVTFFLPRTYLASSKVLYRDTGVNVSTDIEEQDALIYSPEVLNRVIDSLDLRTKWGQRYARGNQLSTEQAFEILQGSLRVNPMNSRVLELQAYSESPDEAVALVNETVESYRRTAGSQAVVLSRATIPTRPHKPILSVHLMMALVLAFIAGAIASAAAGIVSAKRAAGSSLDSESARRGQSFRRISAAAAGVLLLTAGGFFMASVFNSSSRSAPIAGDKSSTNQSNATLTAVSVEPVDEPTVTIEQHTNNLEQVLQPDSSNGLSKVVFTPLPVSQAEQPGPAQPAATKESKAVTNTNSPAAELNPRVGDSVNNSEKPAMAAETSAPQIPVEVGSPSVPQNLELDQVNTENNPTLLSLDNSELGEFPSWSEEGARHRTRVGFVRPIRVPTRNVDYLIRKAPVQTGYRFELWEKLGKGADEYRLKREVARIPLSVVQDPGATRSMRGEVLWLRGAGRFYVQWDSVGAGVFHYYGPFNGDPHFVLSEPPPSKEAVARDLQARLDVARQILSFSERDAALSAIARDAAREGSGDFAKKAIGQITAFSTRDDAAADAARVLVSKGQRAEAFDIARTITGFSKRDDVLRELAGQ